MKVTGCAVPPEGLLAVYLGQGATYTDCFESEVAGEVALPQLLEAFYTTWLFRLERTVLMLPLRRKVRDAEITAMAQGADRFAVWRVEARTPTQILLCDQAGHTRSYLAVQQARAGGTRLIFGSAVVAQNGQPLGRVVSALIPLHQLYSKALLGLAARKLARG